MRVITGKARGCKLKSVLGYDVRPTTDKIKESVFSVIQFRLEGRDFLDLFSGSGQMGIEALSRGAKSATFVENSRNSIAVIKENLAHTKLEGCANVVNSSVENFLFDCDKQYDIIYMDPPYHSEKTSEILKSCLSKLIKNSGTLLCEHACDEVYPQEINRFQKVKVYKYGKIGVSLYEKIREWFNLKKAIYPGSFDPVTLGHMDIIARASIMFDELIIAVLTNIDKKTKFSANDRKDLLLESIKEQNLKNVNVVTFDGLLVDCAKKYNAKIIVKGLRAVSDFEYEFQMALMNKSLDKNIETIYLMSNLEYMYLSSSAVKQISQFGADISTYVPKCVSNKINNKGDI